MLIKKHTIFGEGSFNLKVSKEIKKQAKATVDSTVLNGELRVSQQTIRTWIKLLGAILNLNWELETILLSGPADEKASSHRNHCGKKSFFDKWNPEIWD